MHPVPLHFYSIAAPALAIVATAGLCTYSRGIPRIFCRGFPQVVDPRHGGLGAQPPDADEFFIFVMSTCSVF